MTMSLRMKIQNPYATTVRFGAGPPPPRPRASSAGTAVGSVSIVAIVMRAASCPQPGPFHLRNFGRRDFVLALVAPAGHQNRDCSGEEADDRHPPDMPDQGKPHDHGKERGDETGWAVARHLDVLIGGFNWGPPGALLVPECVDRLDSGQHCVVVSRRRRGGRPLQGSAVPRVASQVEALLAR